MSLRTRLASVGLVVAGVASCSADEPVVRPQWTVTLRTDAPLPLVADRVLVEVLREDGTLACAACRRLLDARRDAWPISFGVAESASLLRVRARLHRAQAMDVDGSPDPRSTIDAVALLPRAPGQVSLALPMRCFGLPVTGTESCAPDTGELAPIAVAFGGRGDPTLSPGTWSEITSADCALSAPDGMACVRGGLFFFRGFEGTDGRQDQLVRLSSFFADRDEMTVARARALIAENPAMGAPTLHTADRTTTSTCQYRGQNDATADAMPLNCVSRSLASALCAAEGKRLPTDAELAYAAGNGAHGTRFPWGDEDDICARAIVARGATNRELVGSESAFECRSQGGTTLAFGPVVGGSALDVTRETGGLRNLGGSLSEWVSDTFASLQEPCWTGRPLLIDPTCLVKGDAVTRGGAWSYEAWTASARFRNAVPPRGAPSIGFRCVQDAR